MWVFGFVFCATLLSAASALESSRKLLVRDVTSPTSAVCRNTVQGLLYMTDDRGRLCKRDELDFSTGCCNAGQQFDCTRCTMHDQCCTEYEDCVSCCLAPQYGAADVAKSTIRSPKHHDAGTWNDAFEYCRGTCRTHGKSTSHENSYIDSRHHCFSKLGKPMLSSPLPEGALAGVEVVLGASHESCDQACAKAKKACSVQHLPLLNSCDRLREVSACEAGCDPGQKAGSVPGYVESGAPKSQRPAVCLYAAGAAAGGAGTPLTFKCGSKEAHFRRLCACI